MESEPANQPQNEDEPSTTRDATRRQLPSNNRSPDAAILIQTGRSTAVRQSVAPRPLSAKHANVTRRLRSEGNTMQFEFAPEKLISEVKKRPGIWDFEHEDYRNKTSRAMLWTELVKVLNPDTATLSKSELRELELQIQKKWKSIRDCYVKSVNNPNKYKRPYVYGKALKFLQKGLTGVPSLRNKPVENDFEETPVHKMVSKKYFKLANEASDDEYLYDNNEDDNMSGGDADTGDDNVDTTLPILHSQPEQFAFASVDYNKEPESSDPDKMFLLSMLPDLRNIPERQKFNVKMELMQVLHNAIYNSSVVE